MILLLQIQEYSDFYVCIRSEQRNGCEKQSPAAASGPVLMTQLSTSFYTLKYFYMCLQSSDLQPEWGQNRIKWGGNLICFVWIISQETCKIAAICITAKYIFANSCLQLHSLHNNSRKVVNGLELDTEHCNVLTLWDLLTNFRVKTILMALNFNNVYSGSNMNVYHIIIDVNCLSRTVVRSCMI